MASSPASQTQQQLQEVVWGGSIPLNISLAPEDCRTYDESLPYLVQVPRLSYLPFLLSRLHSFFIPALIDPEVPPHHGWFSFEGVPMKWQHPVGLLYDLFSGAEPTNSFNGKKESNGQPAPPPWKLNVHFTQWPTEQLVPMDAEWSFQIDAFINSVKQADFLRNGSAKVMMALSKEDSTRLWEAVVQHDLPSFNTIHQKLLNPSGGEPLRHVPMKLYLPTTPSAPGFPGLEQPRGFLKTVQSLVSPAMPNNQEQTLGTALNAVLPTVFPSRRSYIHAQAVMHGAVLPLSAPVEELMRACAFADGFLHVAVVMIG